MGPEEHASLSRGARGEESRNDITHAIQDLHPAVDGQASVRDGYPAFGRSQGVEGRDLESASNLGAAEGEVMPLISVSVVLPRGLEEIGRGHPQLVGQGLERRRLGVDIFPVSAVIGQISIGYPRGCGDVVRPAGKLASDCRVNRMKASCSGCRGMARAGWSNSFVNRRPSRFT